MPQDGGMVKDWAARSGLISRQHGLARSILHAALYGSHDRVGFFPYFFPRLSDVSLRRIRLSNAKAQREPVIQPRVRQVKIAATVQRVHESLIVVVPRLQPEANQIQRDGRRQLKSCVLRNPLCEFL